MWRGQEKKECKNKEGKKGREIKYDFYDKNTLCKNYCENKKNDKITITIF